MTLCLIRHAQSANNTGISHIDFHSDHASLIYHNRLEHLPPELMS